MASTSAFALNQRSRTSLDAIVADPSLLEPKHVTFARGRITQAEASFKQSMLHGRALTRPIIKAHGSGNPWPDPQAFLELWSDPKNLAWYISRDLRALTCPHCGHQKVETMPTNTCVHFYDCEGCGAILRPKPGDCCVFCSYGSSKCPPRQQERDVTGLGTS